MWMRLGQFCTIICGNCLMFIIIVYFKLFFFLSLLLPCSVPEVPVGSFRLPFPVGAKVSAVCGSRFRAARPSRKFPTPCFRPARGSRNFPTPCFHPSCSRFLHIIYIRVRGGGLLHFLQLRGEVCAVHADGEGSKTTAFTNNIFVSVCVEVYADICFRSNDI